VQGLRDDDDIAGLQHDVLLEIAPADHVRVLERQSLLLTRVVTPEDHDVAQGGKRRRAAGHTQRLHHVDTGIHHEIARLLDLADDVDLVALDLLDGDGHHRIGDEFLQLCSQLLLQLLHALVTCIHLPGQRKGELAIRPHQHRSLQIRLLPHRDQEGVTRLYRVGQVGRRGRDSADWHDTGKDQRQEEPAGPVGYLQLHSRNLLFVIP
jgi:hypothetical protein